MMAKFLLLPALLFITASACWAQAPGNDSFANRSVISNALPASAGGTTANATAEGGEPAHAGDFYENVASNSVWYRWTSSVTGVVRVGTTNATFDGAIAVYTGTSIAALTEVQSADRLSVGDEDVIISAQSGVTYVIAVDGYSTTGAVTEAGTFTLGISLVTSPANDNFANATVLPSVFGGTASDFDGHNFEATAEGGEPNHANGVAGGGNIVSNSVWYRWTAPASSLIGINVDADFDPVPGGDFDCTIGVYTGTAFANLTEVAAADRYTTDSPERAVFDAVGGTEYWIAVDGYWNQVDPAERGRFSLEIYIVPPNDDFLLGESIGPVLPLTVGGTTENGSTEFAFGEPEHANPDGIQGLNLSSNSVWYFWTANGTGEVTVKVDNVVFDPVIAVYTGASIGALTPVASADAGADGVGETLTFQATTGVAYTIAVDAWSGDGFPAPGGTFALSLEGDGFGGGGGDGPYETWIAGFPSLTGADAEQDASPLGDGVSNLIKLVLGLDPTIRLADDPNRGNYPTLTTFNGDPALQYVVDPDNLGDGAGAIQHGGQVSDDLQAWNDVGSLNVGGNNWIIQIQTVGADARFGRLGASAPAG